MKLTAFAALAAVSILAFAGSANADTVTYNGVPNDNWNYGSGNNYTPSNSLVLFTSVGDELALRVHQTFVTAPASVGNVYSFALGTTPISFDWGIDATGSGGFDGVTAEITLDRLGAGGGTASYDPFFVGNDNDTDFGNRQNSFRLTFGVVNGGLAGDINFDAAVDSIYRINLTAYGLDGGTKSLTTYAKIGDGIPGFVPGAPGAVPEPATWAMMVMGFGFAGSALRRRRLALAA